MSNKLKIVQPSKDEDTSALREERMALWVQEHGAKVVYGFVAALALLIVLLVWFSRSASQEEADYLRAEMNYQEFVQSSPNQTDPEENPAFQRLRSAIQEHPELGARYYGPITQTFLRLGDVSLALKYGQKSLPALSKEDLPFYEDFSKTSLLVADGQYDEAYRRAQFLQKKMQEAGDQFGKDTLERGFGDHLVVMNAIRMGMLQQRLNRDVDELQAWETLRQFDPEQNDEVASIHIEKKAMDVILSSFKTGKISFADYIDARKKTLRQ